MKEYSFNPSFLESKIQELELQVGTVKDRSGRLYHYKRLKKLLK